MHQTPPPCSEMGLPDVGPLDADTTAAIARALGHPSRIRILVLFAGHRPLMAHEIVDGCELAQSTVSEHLRILRKASVVVATKDGPRTWYCLRRSVLQRFSEAVDELTAAFVSMP